MQRMFRLKLFCLKKKMSVECLLYWGQVEEVQGLYLYLYYIVEFWNSVGGILGHVEEIRRISADIWGMRWIFMKVFRGGLE